MKILAVHNSYQQPGGEDVVFKQEQDLLRRAGHTVVTYERSNFEIKANRLVVPLADVKNAVWSSHSRRSFRAALIAEKPDVVHVHNTFVVISPSIFSVCAEHDVPVVHTLHNYRLFCPTATFFRDGHVCEECVEHGLWRSVLHGCYRDSRPATATIALMLAVHRRLRTWSDNVDAFIALTQFVRHKFLDCGLPPDRVFVKPNFVYPDPGGERADAGDYALFVGRLSPEKRVSTVLAAWERVNGEVPLRVIGGGPQQLHLQSEGARLGLNNVHFCGQLSRERTIAAMQGARFLIFSSEWFENFPVTLAESFACGLPAIASHLGAMREIVDDGRTGLHFIAGDAHDLAHKVRWAWNHPEEMHQMGEAARAEYLSKYTAEANYPLLMDIYARAIAHRRAHAGQGTQNVKAGAAAAHSG